MINQIKTAIVMTGLAALLAGCSVQRQEEPKVNPIVEAKVAELGKGFLYCGMPSKETFSLSERSNYAVNHYYPTNATNIHFFGSELEVLSVNPESIKVRLIKREKN